MMITSIIDGQPWTGAAGRTVQIPNPARLDEVVGEVQLAAPDALATAAARARVAQRDWAKVPAPIRGEAIHAMGELFRANKEALSQVITREIGKPIGESRGEVQEAIDTCTFFASEGRRLYGQTVPSEMPDKQLFTFREPVGVMTVVTAGNFPVAVPSWYLVPALLAGNAVVWKPAEYTPAIAEAVTRIVHAAGIPTGAFQLVLTDGPDTFAGLEQALEAGDVDKVGFTGSSDVGRRIAEVCGRNLVSPTLELGGKNPLVVMPDADLDLAVEGALFSGFGTAGQRCTSLGITVVHESVADDFLGRFSKAVEQAAVGDPAAGIYEHPTIVAGVTMDDALYRNETFGPIVPVATFGDFDEAIELANTHGYGLSGSIYTTNPQHAFRFRERVSAGMVSVNNSTSGAEAHLPFGGNGKSGNGARQSGIWVLDQVTRWQSMNWDFSGKLQKAQMDVGGVEADLDFRL